MSAQPTSNGVGGTSALTTAIDKLLGTRSKFNAGMIKTKETANDLFETSGPEVTIAHLTSTIDLLAADIDMALDMIDMLKTCVSEADIRADNLKFCIDHLKAINVILKTRLAESEGFNAKVDALLEKL